MEYIDLSDANILLKAFGRAISNSKWKDSSQRADHDALSMISALQDDIRNGTYKPQPMTEFVAQERGKTRLIHGNTIRDRVVRHALCDEVLMPAIKNFVVYDNSASQIGKGVDFARRRLKTHLQKYYREKLGHRPGSLPNTEWNSDRICSLPLFPDMTEQDQDDVIAAIKDIFAKR